MMASHRRLEMIHGLLFALSNRIPLKDALADYPVPRALKQRLVHSLDTGMGLAQALDEAGFSGAAAQSLSLGESLGAMHEALAIQKTLDGMRARIRLCAQQPLVYPCIIVTLSLAVCIFFHAIGLLQGYAEAMGLAGLALLLLVLQGAVLLPERMAARVYVLRSMHRRMELYAFYAYMEMCTRGGMDETTALRRIMECFDFKLIFKGEPLRRLESGVPFARVLKEISHLRGSGGSTPNPYRLQDDLALLKRETQDAFEERATSLQLVLHPVGLLISGSALFLLALRIFAALYGGNPSW